MSADTGGNGPEQTGRVVHLYRGAPPVRSWSRYQTTVKGFTLCGVNRGKPSRQARDAARCIETDEGVSCSHCLSLMRPAGCTQTATRTEPDLKAGTARSHQPTDGSEALYAGHPSVVESHSKTEMEGRAPTAGREQ
jgi:hypothetical protein